MSGEAPKRRQTKPQQIAESKALKRDNEALRMRERGATYQQISDALGYGSDANAFRAVKRRLTRLRETTAEAADAVRELELRRLDAMLAGLVEKAESGDTAAVASVLRIQERRTAYLGLDVPKALHVELSRNIDALLERVKRVVPPDVYEQVLAAAAGVDGPPEAGGAESGEGEGVDRDVEESG